MKMTPWFNSRTKPIHVGVYEVKGPYDSTGWYSYWNGSYFGFRTCLSADRAYELRNAPTCLPKQVSWRGLAEQPK